LSIALAFGLLALAAPAQGVRHGRCVIASGDEVWRGRCWFEAQGRRGVHIGWVPGHRFPYGIGAITIASADGRSGRMRFHLAFGDDVEAGTVRRSRRDRHCWTGEGYRICAY
jgi:hypothetical protein